MSLRDWWKARGAAPSEPDRKAMLDYLEAAFPPRAGPRGWQNPFQR